MKDKLIADYPLTKKVDCPFECYEVMKRRYVIFFDLTINRDNMESLLRAFEEATRDHFSKVKTLIIVGHTDEKFDQKDLLFFNGIDMFVVYYLKNDEHNEIYFNDQRVFWFSVDWKKIIRRFNKILK